MNYLFKHHPFPAITCFLKHDVYSAFVISGMMANFVPLRWSLFLMCPIKVPVRVLSVLFIYLSILFQFSDVKHFGLHVCKKVAI